MQHRSSLADAALLRRRQLPGRLRPMKTSQTGSTTRSKLRATYPSIHGQSHGDGERRVGAMPAFMNKGVAAGLVNSLKDH